MARIDAILELVKDQGASDLHRTTGSPPMVRIGTPALSALVHALLPTLERISPLLPPRSQAA